MPTASQKNLDVRVELAIATVIIVLSLSAQAVIIWNNTGYVGHNFGLIMVLAYVSATVVVLLRPLILPYIEEEIKNHRLFHTLLLAFIAWITVEENVHAAHSWAAPEAATSLASAAFGPDAAKQAVTLLMVAISYAVMEFLGHLHHVGFHMAHSCHKKLCTKH